MKKVLMIARAFPPFNPVGHSIRVVKFIKYLPALGWLPIVLTVDDKQEYETLKKVGSESLLQEIQPQVKIYRTATGEPSLKFLERERTFSRWNCLSRMIVKVLGGVRRWSFRNILLPDRYLTWLPFATRMGLHIVQNEGIDVIFATCPPYSAILVGACLKILSDKPLILDFRDDWIGTPWHLAKPGLLRSIDRRLERCAVRMADKVILVTEYSKNAFLDRYPTQPHDKFVLIPNGCDLEDFAVINSLPTAPHDSKFTIVHAGSLNVSKNWGRSPAGLFQAVHDILQKQPDLQEQLTLLFAGDLPEEYRQLAGKLGLSGVVKGLGHLSHDEALRLCKSADMLLAINYDDWPSLIPAKLYEYWAAAGPPILLLSCPGAAASFVKQHSIGLVVEPSDVAGIAQTILSVYHQSKTLAPLRVNATGIEDYDRRALTRELVQVLSTVCDPPC